MEYHCGSCGMGVKGLRCTKCNSELVDKHIDTGGKSVKVAQCPECEGKIKSPQCCGKDMQAKKAG